MNYIESIFESALVFKNMYDIIRVVDPITKLVYKYHKGNVDITTDNCYAFWKNGEFCKNCISMRAYCEDKTFVKLEYNKEKLFMLVASNFVMEGRRCVIEMLKDVTESCIIENFHNMSIAEVQKKIDAMNDTLIKDELTGIYNRKFINERLPVDIFTSINSKIPFSVLMADIDLFKNVNDNYGHLAGDAILKKFSDLLSKSIRRNVDWVARYGGEEFLIALDKTSSDKAFEISEKLRKIIENETFEHEGNKIKITASFGICTLEDNEPGMDMNKMISCADQNLYAAKQAGRNKSVK